MDKVSGACFPSEHNHRSPTFRWALQKGFVVLPKSVVPERQRENADVMHFTIPDDLMRELDTLECDFVTGWDPIRDHEV